MLSLYPLFHLPLLIYPFTLPSLSLSHTPSLHSSYPFLSPPSPSAHIPPSNTTSSGLLLPLLLSPLSLHILINISSLSPFSLYSLTLLPIPFTAVSASISFLSLYSPLLSFADSSPNSPPSLITHFKFRVLPLSIQPISSLNSLLTPFPFSPPLHSPLFCL